MKKLVFILAFKLFYFIGYGQPDTAKIPCSNIKTLVESSSFPDVDTVNCTLEDVLKSLYTYSLDNNPFYQTNAITALIKIYENNPDVDSFTKKSILDTILYSLEQGKSDGAIPNFLYRSVNINSFSESQIHRICQIFLKGNNDMDLIFLLGVIDQKQLIPELKNRYLNGQYLRDYQKDAIIMALCRMNNPFGIAEYFKHLNDEIKIKEQDFAASRISDFYYFGSKQITDSLFHYFYKKDVILFDGTISDNITVDKTYTSIQYALIREFIDYIPEFPKDWGYACNKCKLPEPKRLQVIEWYEKNKDTYTVKQWPEGRSNNNQP